MIPPATGNEHDPPAQRTADRGGQHRLPMTEKTDPGDQADQKNQYLGDECGDDAEQRRAAKCTNPPVHQGSVERHTGRLKSGTQRRRHRQSVGGAGFLNMILGMVNAVMVWNDSWNAAAMTGSHGPRKTKPADCRSIPVWLISSVRQPTEQARAGSGQRVQRAK